MEQHLESDLRKYHELFSGGRCKAWELEELIVRAIRADTATEHHPRWKEGGHDDKADITVRTNGTLHSIQIKSGKIDRKKTKLILSGHRLGRYKGNKKLIGDYLNNRNIDLISIPYKCIDDDVGRNHVYYVYYVPYDIMTGVKPNKWKKHGKQYIQTNKHGVRFSLRPSMSWQIWWEVPLNLLQEGRIIEIR